MKGMAKKKLVKMSLSLVLAVCMSLLLGVAAMAADDLVFDNYNRSDLADFGGSGAGAQWTGGDAGKSATLDGNALKLEYGSNGWFGSGGGIDASSYKYLKIRVKGAAGGEGADFDLNYAVGETVKTTGKSFADLSGSKITKDYQDIVIDLAANSIDKGIQALHFNFHEGASGTIWIDDISFTNAAGEQAAADDADQPAAAADEDSSAEANPKTGDATNTTLYILLAALSGVIVLGAAYQAKRTQSK